MALAALAAFLVESDPALAEDAVDEKPALSLAAYRSTGGAAPHTG